MRKPLTLALCSIMMALAACARADAPGAATPTPATPAPPAPASAGVPGNTELENRGVAMMQRLADVFAADANDCAKLAFDIKAFVTEHRELLDELAALDRTQSDQERATFAERNQAVQDAVASKMAPALDACGNHADVRAAMAQFPTS